MRNQWIGLRLRVMLHLELRKYMVSSYHPPQSDVKVGSYGFLIITLFMNTFGISFFEPPPLCCIISAMIELEILGRGTLQLQWLLTW